MEYCTLPSWGEHIPISYHSYFIWGDIFNCNCIIQLQPCIVGSCGKEYFTSSSLCKQQDSLCHRMIVVFFIEARQWLTLTLLFSKFSLHLVCQLLNEVSDKRVTWSKSKQGISRVQMIVHSQSTYLVYKHNVISNKVTKETNYYYYSGFRKPWHVLFFSFNRINIS